MFQRVEGPPLDAAVLVEVVNSSAGKVRKGHPTFDWDNVKLIGPAASAT